MTRTRRHDSLVLLAPPQEGGGDGHPPATFPLQHTMRRPTPGQLPIRLRLHLLLWIGGLLTLTPALALAQSATLLILPNTTEGITVSDAEDIYEESAYLAEDLGSFRVTRHYELADGADPVVYAQAVACRGDATCLGALESLNPWDFVLILDISAVQPPYGVRYTLVDRWAMREVGSERAWIGSVRDFQALEPALVNTLAGSGLVPRWQQAPEAATTPEAPATPPVGTALATDDPARAIGRGEWLMLGGALGVTGGVLLGFAADSKLQELQTQPHPRNELERLQSQGNRRAAASTALLITGAATLATGAALTIVDLRRERTDGRISDLQLEAAPLSGQLLLRGRFTSARSALR